MKAMILSAGLGTRLRPLTNDKPKALVEYKSKPLLEIVIKKLINQGFNEFVINIHHFGQKIIDFLSKKNYFNKKIIISDERNKLLDTGGGIYKAKDFFKDEDFLVHNVDILSDINIKNIYKKHKKTKSLATLAVQKRKSSKKLYFNDNDESLCKWKNEKTGEEKTAKTCKKEKTGFAFSGIHLLNTQIFEYMQPGVYSIIDTYLLAAKKNKITFFDHSTDFWRDMGKRSSFKN